MDKDRFIVMLDNGHASTTAGKRSPDNSLLEYLYNREIVHRIAELLKKEEIEYYIVTPEVKHDVPLSARAARANAKYNEFGKKGIFISVHVNAAGNGQWMNARGWSAWTSNGQTAGDKLADCMYEAAHEVLDPIRMKIREDWKDKDPDYEENFTVLTKTICPAVLTENFFMDNKEDVAFLLSEEGKQSIAELHAKGIKKYIDKYIK